MPRSAIVTGYTGLVGRCLVDRLVSGVEYDAIKLVGRRAPAQSDRRLQFIPSELGALQRLGSQLAADDAYCCLGTTLRSAGSRAAFERVDFHMVVDFARAVRVAGAKRFFLVSSLSADPRSPIFYSRVKGRAEQALGEIGFEALHILRPSLLLGAREEHRPGEAIAQKLMPAFNRLMIGPAAKYRAVRAEEVAAALLSLARRPAPDDGVHVHTLPLKA